MTLISLTEWAAREGITDSAARKKAVAGRLRTAQKIGRNWVIDDSEQNADYRRKEMTKIEMAKALANMTDDEMYAADEHPQITHMAGPSRDGHKPGAIFFLVEIDRVEMLYEEVTPEIIDEEYDWASDKKSLAELYEQVREAANQILAEAKSYKDYKKQHLGESDISALVARFGDGDTTEIKFGGDGSYSAYIVDESADIGGHYEIVAQGEFWLWIYDDSERMATFRADKIIVYRAGDMGCIIQLIN